MAQDFNYQEALLQCKTMEDITGKNGLVQKIIKDAVEHILGQELEDYISKKTITSFDTLFLKSYV